MTIEHALQLLGFGDQVLTTMGPAVSWLFAWAAGGAVAQGLKFPLEKLIDRSWFDWTVRTIAVVATLLFALLVSDSLPPGAALLCAVLQPVWYHFSLAMIRRFWPWMEVSAVVGSVNPPREAFDAAARRKADKSGEDSGT